MDLILNFLLGTIYILPALCRATTVEFYLHVPENVSKQLLTYENLKTLRLDKNRTYKILFHGWTNNYSVPWYKDLIELYNDRGHNVIANDYGNSVSNLLYIPAVMNARSIGSSVAEMIVHLVQKCGIALEKFHFIGHSLGAHIAGFAGSAIYKILKKRIARITGLDPAGPFFVSTPASKRLSRDDAHFVDVIHTNDMGIGNSDVIGHADFYPNGGNHQVGCDKGDISCNHRKVLEYFKESIQRNKFASKRCVTYKKFPKKCRKRKDIHMGEYTNVKARGRYYLLTNQNAPYGKGREEF